MNNIQINSKIQTMVDIQSDFSEDAIPKGSIGIVVECYEQPEGYAIDIPIPDERLVGGFTYENVVLTPDQFIVRNDVQVYHLLFRSYNARRPSSKTRSKTQFPKKRKSVTA